jgi:hypothetical protein
MTRFGTSCVLRRWLRWHHQGVSEVAGAPRVRLIGREGCHLCDEARAVVARVTEELGEAFDERDIDREPDLHTKYWDQIPVVLVDGRQVAFWTVDPDRLRAALQGRARGWRRGRLTS